ncbi:MAG: phage integrase N-terminal SAM-like domain-containing protein [Sulfitobacter sp.]
MSKSYKKIRLKKDRVYSVEQLCDAYSVSANTISNWVGEGLIPSDKQTPYLFRGAVVQGYHKQRRLRGIRKLRPGEFMCRGCQTYVFPKTETVKEFNAKNGKHMFSAQCPDCPSKLQKISSEADRDFIEDCRNPNTPTDCPHEENTSTCGGIWTSAEKDIAKSQSENDRIIYKWQTYAGGYSEQTVEKHLAAIRFFENNLQGKSFAKLTTDDFAAVRKELKKRATPHATDSLSASTIKHIVSHLIAFFDWLLKQDGYRRLPRDFAGYLKLPKAVVARSVQVKQKEFPSLSEAEELLNEMPSKSLVDLRARALFALAFLGALRADTLVSLQIKHFDVKRRLILQDASVVRAKAGKSLNIFWFQIPTTFETAVVNWLERLRWFGFSDEDALFPDLKYAKHRVRISGRNAVPVPVMSTTHAVTEAFNIACRNIEAKYTPHAAKHTIGAERDIRALTHEERKAWSLNMGHESEQTTERHYGTMPDDRRFEVLENIGSKKTIDPRNLSVSEKAKILDSIFEAIGDGR